MEYDILYLIREGTKWVRSQRESLRSRAIELNPSLRGHYSNYFTTATLDAARLYSVEVIPNPSFYATLEKEGIPIPIDFQAMDGITYDDTILITNESFKGDGLIPLVFHELVHVAQYHLLGVDRFLEQYVRGWADNNSDYRSIPLEKEAYGMQERFEQGETFAVEDELAA